jgi:leucine dehydrogenase
MAEVLNMLGGAAIVTVGPGVTADDLRILRTATPYVVGLSEEDGGSGDPSPHKARGVLEAIKASLDVVFENDAIRGRTFAIQGLGKVGCCLAALLGEAGGTVIGADVDAETARQAGEQYPISLVSPDEILTVSCDVLIPCAVPWILTAKTIPHLRCRIVAGAANDQLGEEKDAQRLHDRGILYAPDFVTNAGGIINMAAELDPEGYRPEEARRRVEGIRTRLRKVFDRAKASSVTPEEAARAQARERIGNVRKANHHYGR